MRAIISTACVGHAPFAVSPDSMTQSDPSSTALATSVASARVGRGLVIIESSICVAVITGLPTRLHLLIIIFCAANTFSIGISEPRSPRATITPSTTSKISSKLSSPSWFSILAMIAMPRSRMPGNSRMASTSLALRMNEAAIMSTFDSTPKAMSRWSFSVMAGRFVTCPGKFMFLVLPSLPPLSMRQVTRLASSSMDVTVKERSASEHKMVTPGFTVVARSS
mmetsp:Transcript_12870/g.40647  ORF Transcript_12870/g.40647 Transcript_12870/m.40647 type:complete len:223 (+) Transcript_12870:571-1239(+)